MSQTETYSVTTDDRVIGTAEKSFFYGGVVNAVKEVLGPLNPDFQAADINEVSSSCSGGVMKIAFSNIKNWSLDQLNELKKRLSKLGVEIQSADSDTASGRDFTVTVDMKQGIQSAAARLKSRGVSRGRNSGLCSVLWPVMILLFAVLAYAFLITSFEAKIQFLQKYVPATVPVFNKVANVLSGGRLGTSVQDP